MARGAARASSPSRAGSWRVRLTHAGADRRRSRSRWRTSDEECLAFDTATRATAVALRDVPLGSGLVLEARDDPPAGARPGHAQRLLALIAELLERSGGCSDGRSDRGRGRAGNVHRTADRDRHARTRSRARGIWSSSASARLRSLALAAAASAPPPGRGVLALIDARRGELFAAGWAPARIHDRAPLVGPSVLEPAALDGTLTALGRTGAPGGRRSGPSGGRRRRSTVPSSARTPGRDGAGRSSRASPVSALAHCVLAAAAPGPPAAVRPEYLRLARRRDARRKARSDVTADGAATRRDRIAIRPLVLRGPSVGDRDRAARVHDPMVAADVRARAVKAVGHLPCRGPVTAPITTTATSSASAVGRLPDLRPLRPGVAPDEHRGRAGAPPAGDRARADRCADRARRRGVELHARGARLEHARRSRSTRATRSAASAGGGATTPTTARTR